MPNIADARKLYPELDGLNDNDAVDVLHENLYADLPRADLAKFLGVAPPPPPPPPPRGMGGYLKDVGIAGARGIIGVPEAALGIADLMTGGQAGKLAEEAGFRPKEAKAILAEYNTPQQKAANQAVQGAKGFFPTVGAMLENPSTIVDQAVESAPSMLVGGAMSRAVLAAVPRMGAIAAGALGEGAVAAGQNAEQVRQEDPNGTLTGKQSAILAASGLLTGGISLAAGNVANKLGIGDIQTMLAQGKFGAVGSTAIAKGASKGVVRRVAEGAATEGVLQELPQSYQEQVAQNIAQGKPWDEGAAEAGAQGMMTGVLMGAGGNVIGGPAAPLPAGPLARATDIMPPGTTESIAAAKAGPVDNTPGVNPDDDPIMARIGALPDGSREEAAKAYAVLNNPKAETGIQNYNKKLLDRLLSQEFQDQITGQKESEAQDTSGQAATQSIATAKPVTERIDPETGEIKRAYDERQADVPKQQDGDFLNLQGIPFTTIVGAKSRQKELGNDYQVIRLAGTKYVVRATPAAPDAGPTKVDAPAQLPAADSAAAVPVAEPVNKPDAVNVKNTPPASPAKAQTQAVEAPKAGALDATGTTTAGTQAGVSGVETTGVSRKEPASWVIRNKETSEVVFETFDKAKVDALNTAKYEAVPIQDYLVGVNQQIKAAEAKPVDQRLIPLSQRETDVQNQITPEPIAKAAPAQALEAKAGTGIQPAAAEAQAGSAGVEAAGVGREGYEKPFTVDAKALKAVIEQEAGGPDNLNPDKLEAVRNGAKSSGNIELAIKQGTGKGDIGVNDGRHRIAVAAERGEQVTVFASEDDQKAIQKKLQAGKRAEFEKLLQNTTSATPAPAVAAPAANQEPANQILPTAGNLALAEKYKTPDDRTSIEQYESGRDSVKNMDDVQTALAQQPSLPPELASQLKEAHKSSGRDVKRSVVLRSLNMAKTDQNGTPLAKRQRAETVKRLEADLALFDRVPEAASASIAAPPIDTKAAAAKLIPDMSDAELTALKDHYGPDHKRTPKLTKEIEKRAENKAPAQEPLAQVATSFVAPEGLEKVRTLYGDNVYMLKSDFASERKLLPLYTSKGVRIYTDGKSHVHRENLDPTGEKQAERNKSNAGSPFIKVITAKNDMAFTTLVSARREMNKRGLADTHAVVAADTVQAGATGFVIQKQQKEQPNENQRPVQQPAGSQEVGETSTQAESTAGQADASKAVTPPRDNGQDDWTVLGKNKNGKTLVQDKRGVRSYVEQGIRIEESVMMRPTRNGMQLSTEHKGEFLTADEVAKDAQDSEDGMFQSKADKLRIVAESAARNAAKLAEDGQQDELDAETRSYEGKANPTYDGKPARDSAGNVIQRPKLKGEDRFEYPQPLSKNDDPAKTAAQARVVDYMNGDIDRPTLVKALEDSGLEQGPMFAITQRLQDDGFSNGEMDALLARREKAQPAPAPISNVVKAAQDSGKLQIINVGDKPAAKPDPLTEQEKAAKAKMLGAAAKLAALLSKNTRANITPEQEQAMLPIVIELFDGAMELGYVKFKQAARYVREFLANTIDQDAADSIPMDTLQGAYIATSRRHKDKAITPKAEVITVESFEELNEQLENPAEKIDTRDKANGNATQQLDQPSTGTLGGAPSQDVRAPDGKRDTGEGTDGRSGSDSIGNPKPDGPGGDVAGSVGADTGAVPVPGGRAQPDAKNAKKPRVPRKGGTQQGDGLFGAAGGLTPDTGANPAPNAPPIAAPQPLAEDFTITDELELGVGGQKTKFKNNIAAIKLVRELESTGRMATPSEQAVLAKYVGWGGLPQAFDAKNTDWVKEYAEITALMTPDELAAARQSTRYAHFTSKEIIQDGIYAAMRQFGFTGGKTLESGAGVGNFIGLMPADMRSAGRFTAIEREPFSSAIARQLYPQQNVQRADFTEFKGNDGYFDASVGNPPFASDPQTDRSGRKHLSGLSLHNYFFAKNIDMLREGGIMAQVVTNYFLDAKGDKARKYMSDRTEMLGAIRLPNSAFAKNANTEVTTDIIFLKKRPDSEVGGKAARADAQRWLNTGAYTDKNGKQVALNQYFIDNPDMMLGDFGAFGTMYGPDNTALVAKPGQDTLALLKEAVGRLPSSVYKSIADTGTDSHVNAAVVALKNPSVKEGGYFVEGDKLMQRLPDIAGEARGVEITAETQWTEKTKLGEPGFERIKSLAAMRTTVRGLLAAEMSDDAKSMTALRKTLNEQYDTYRDTHALINDPSTLRVFDDDPDFPLLASLEHSYLPGIGPAAAKRLGVKPTVSTAKKGPIFTQRVVAARQTVQKVESPADALAVSMAERGKLDAAYIGTLLGMEPEAVLKELSTGEKPLLFRDPATDEYVLRDAYLSGNVRAKLAQAKQAGMFDNVNALEAVQPEDVGSHEITARLGSPWVPTEVYKDFAQALYGEESRASVAYMPLNSSFQVTVMGASEVAMNNTWGTPEYSGGDMLQALMNNRSIKVTYLDSDKKTRTDVDATERANTKAQEVKEKFNDWIFSDPDRSELLTKAYNETNNNYVTRVYEGSNMTFPGKVPDSVIKFRRHQRNAIARIVQDRTALLDHVVGAGKTFTVVAGAMELKRTGLARKPMVVVPNHLVKQWATDFYRLYPGANVLTATKKDFEKANRRKFLARIATGDWDAVVIAHSSYGFIKPAPEFEAEFNGREIQKIMITIQSVEAEDGDKKVKKRTIKQLEGMKERLENRIRQLRDKPMDDLLDFEQIGVDQLFVDEAHMFKNLMYTTKMQGVAGLNDPTGSQRSYDMYVKTNQVMEKNGRGQGVVFATGTPVSNSLAEMYHMMRYLMPTQMKELGFESFDAWANTYASVEQVWMQAPSGDGFKAQNRMSNFVNTPELLKMFDQVSDTVTMDDIKQAYKEENNGDEFPLPKLKGGRRTPVSLEKSKAQDAYMETIAQRAKAIEQRKGPPQKGDDNILVVMSDARKAAMDIRLVDPEVTERESGGRIDRSTDEVVARYKQFDAVKGTQLVFSDMGTPLKHAKKELKEYEAMLARVQAGSEDVATSATLGNEAAMGIMEDAEAAQAELDAMGQDWLSAVKSAMRGFSIYDDFKAALIEKGVPEEEIAFIHDANTDDQKAALFRKVNAGQIRVLLGSTAKMGAGTNVQDRLVAEHHLDVPWRPSDVEQREGRIERQGNLFATPPTKDKANPHHIPGFEIEILAYVTRDTLDMRMWQVQETKLKMINQLRTRKIGREIDNAFEDMELSAGEMQAAATGDINLLKEIQLRNDVKKLEQRRRSFDGQRNDLIARKRRNAEQLRYIPGKLKAAEIEATFAEQYKSDLFANAPPFKMNIDGKDYTDAKEAQEYLRVKDEATEERTDLAGEVTTKKAPLSVTIDGELIKSRATMAELYSNARGDIEPIMWNMGGETYRRRTVLANAIRQNVTNALADENVQQVGTFGAYSVAVEGSVEKGGNVVLEVTMRRGGEVKLSNSMYIGDTSAAPRRVVEQAENLMQSAISEANYLEHALQRAKKDAIELDAAPVAGEWPDQLKLDAARAAHRDVLALLKSKDLPTAGTDALILSPEQYESMFGTKPNYKTGFAVVTPGGGAYKNQPAGVFETREQATAWIASQTPTAAAPDDAPMPANIKQTGAPEANDTDVVLSRSTSPANQAQTTQAVEKIVQGITSRWANAPEVVVVYDMTDPRIPAKVRARDMEQRSGGAKGDPEGFFLGGKAYIVASQVSTPKDVARVLFHESLGHFGLRGVFGEQLKPILQQLAGLRRAEVAAKAKQYGLDMSIESERLQAAEEVLAEMAQTRPEMGFVKRAIAVIRTWLRRNVPGFKNMALTDADIIANYILPARGFVERGQQSSVGERVPAFSRSAVSEPTAPDSGGAPMFSRSLAGALNSTQDLKLPAGYIVNDFFKGNGKLNWWHKTVGTQYNLAQRNPVFKKVFDKTQDFINDVSFYATEAADLAPKILPKLESFKDLAKSPISAADNKAIAAPIFEGTLVWMRDGAGKPIKASVMEEAATRMGIDEKAQRLFRENKMTEGLLKMWQGLPIEQYEKLIAGKYAREFLKPGIVFKPAELKSLFNLTDGQVALYNEFRAATDKSLTNLAVSDMVRYGGDDVAAVRDDALAMGDVDAAAVLLRDHLLELADGSERSDVLIDTANKMIDKADRARDLMERGYAPLSRFGSHSLDVVDEKGDRVYFGLFESEAEANKMGRQMRANFPQGTISQGTMSDEEYKLFAGVSPETVELFGEMLGLESGGDEAGHQAFQSYLKLAKANRSAMKRLIERKGIAGFSEDPGRVLAGFVYSNARQTSSGLHMGDMAQSVSDIPKGQGELKDAAVQLMDYVKNPQEEAQKIRGLLFAQYLGGSIASAMVNLTQPLNVTFPWLSQYGGVIKAAGQMKNALADAMKDNTGDKTLDAALKKAEEDGVVSPQEVFHLMAQAQGRATLKPGDGTATGDALAKGSNALSKLSLAWGKVFSVAEQFNRRTTFIAAYRTAVEQKLGDPAAFAEKAVNETQFVYNKGAKPKWARGAIGGVLFTFKSYSINYVELLSRMANSGPEGKKAALLALGMLFLMAGSGGLPFAEDLDDIVDGVMQRLGYNFSSKRAKQDFFTGILGRDGAQFVERGVSGLAGVPIDVSGRMGMGNLIPGTGLFTKKADHTSDVLELLGPAGDLGKRAFQAAGKLVDGDVTGRTGAMATMSATAMRNLVQAIDMANTGMYRDATGKKVIDVDGYDVLSKAIGFQPNDVARVQDATRQVQNMVAQNKMRESEIASQWAQGIFEKDADKVQAARDALKRWNESNPDTKIRIKMPQIISRVKAMREDKVTRMARTAPKEIRASVRRELADIQ